MVIAAVAAFCVLLPVAAFVFPRLSRHLQRGGHKAVGVGQRGAAMAPAGSVAAVKPFNTAQKAIGKSGSGGRRGRGKLPL